MIAALLISMLVSGPVSDTLSFAEMSAVRLSPVTAFATGSGYSAAAWLFSPLDTYTSASASWVRRGEESPLLQEEGRQSSEGVIDIHSLVRLNEASAVRGNVQYRNGMKKGVMWNSSSDYDIVRPYAVADSVGGDVKREQYAFSGGYASRRDRLHYGFEGSYRALHEYRMVDPRPRNIVSDLTVRVSVGYRFTYRYLLDFSTAYRRYSQSQNLSFYNQKGSNSSVFHLTGLGNHFGRFEGGTSAYTSTRYAGNGLELSLNLLPDSVGGWRAGLTYSLLDIVHHLPNQNEVPYTELYTRNARAEVSFVSKNGGFDYAAGLQAGYESRKGVESIIDNGSAGRFLELMRFSMYSSDMFSAGVCGTGEWGREDGRWSIDATADFLQIDSRYQYPLRKLDTRGLDIDIKTGYTVLTGNNLIKAVIEAGRYKSFGAGMTIPPEYTLDKLLAFYTDRRIRMACSSWVGGLSLRWEREIGNSSLFALTDARYVLLDGGADALYTTVTIGFIF